MQNTRVLFRNGQAKIQRRCRGEGKKQNPSNYYFINSLQKTLKKTWLPHSSRKIHRCDVRSTTLSTGPRCASDGRRPWINSMRLCRRSWKSWGDDLSATAATTCRLQQLSYNIQIVYLYIIYIWYMTYRYLIIWYAATILSCDVVCCCTILSKYTARPYGLPAMLEWSSNIILRRAQKPALGQCFGIYQTTNPKP